MLAVLLLSVTSCEVAPPEGFANNTATEQDLAGAFLNDTVTIYGESILLDTIRTGNISYVQYGMYTHPWVGTVACTSYINIRPNDERSPGRIRELESLTLNLTINSVTGDPLVPLVLDVYQLDSVLSFSKNYSSVLGRRQNYINRERLLTTVTIPRGVTDLNNTGLAFDIDLTQSLGPLILANQDSITNVRPDAFANIIKGIALVPRSGNFIVTGLQSNNRMKMTYRDANGVKQDYFFGAGNGVAHFTSIRANREGTGLAGLQRTGDKVSQEQNQNRVVVQAGTGVRTLLKMPGLNGLGDKLGKVTLLKAVLEMRADSALPGPNFVNNPRNVFILESNDRERPASFINNDASRGGTTFTTFGYNPTTRLLRADITSYVHNVLRGNKVDKGMLIYMVNSDILTAFLRLNNDRTQETQRMKLKLYYINTPGQQ